MRARSESWNRIGVGLAGLMVVLFSILMMRKMAAPDRSLEAQVRQGLGCRNNDEVVVLQVTNAGLVEWHDPRKGDRVWTESLQDSVLRIHAMADQGRVPVVGILASEDTPMVVVRPLLEAAHARGLARGILAMDETGDLRSAPGW